MDNYCLYFLIFFCNKLCCAYFEQFNWHAPEVRSIGRLQFALMYICTFTLARGSSVADIIATFNVLHWSGQKLWLQYHNHCWRCGGFDVRQKKKKKCAQNRFEYLVISSKLHMNRNRIRSILPEFGKTVANIHEP